MLSGLFVVLPVGVVCFGRVLSIAVFGFFSRLLLRLPVCVLCFGLALPISFFGLLSRLLLRLVVPFVASASCLSSCVLFGVTLLPGHRKSVVLGKSVDLGGRRIFKKKIVTIA